MPSDPLATATVRTVPTRSTSSVKHTNQTGTSSRPIDLVPTSTSGEGTISVSTVSSVVLASVYTRLIKHALARAPYSFYTHRRFSCCCVQRRLFFLRFLLLVCFQLPIGVALRRIYEPTSGIPF
jgi:hypothetical protein